ncbi:formyltransferase family protein [Billgrantia antri]|uniref:formyltransferase family protein n=1 Tax=Billgrantia antri TaxID=2846777 RepID=UPI003B216F00
MENSSITILVDNNSWIIPYAKKLVRSLRERGMDAALTDSPEKVQAGWINFMLGCTRIVTGEVLLRNRHNLVVHESDLPAGRGFAPMAWQILEGKQSIPICLIEAAEAVDAGDIWIKDVIELDGTELCEEWRRLQGEKTVQLCLKFVDEYKALGPMKQKGTPSWYSRRRSEDSRLDADKNLRDQFNLLRVVDNERYPAFFELDGQVYKLHIFKACGGDGEE